MTRKPRFLFRGKRGAVLKKLMNAINMIRVMDAAEQAQAIKQLRVAVLFSDRPATERALQTLQDQANTLYSMKG
jgi:hypothetical protein